MSYFGLSANQFLTLLFAVAIAVPTWANYQYAIYNVQDPVDNSPSGTPNDRFASFIMAWDLALPFLFVAYAYVTVLSTVGSERIMYRNVCLVLSIVAWAFVIARPIGGGTLLAPGNQSWDQVARYVATPLAAGSLFVLPVSYLV